MKRTSKLLGMIVLALAFSLIGCDNGGGGSNKGPGTVPPGTGGDYKLQWLAYETSRSEVESIISTQNWDVTQAGPNAGWAKDPTATAIYNYAKNNANTPFSEENGSFESLVNFSEEGVSAPNELKTALNANKNNVPLAGIFDAVEVAVFFYITKN